MTELSLLGRIDLRPEASSVVEARRDVATALRSASIDESVVETACLLTSELVTNAVLHGRSTVEVRTFADAGFVRVEVADGSPILPRLRASVLYGTTGRGLHLVASLATRWGVERVDSPTFCKAVWFELDGNVPTVQSEAAFDWESVEPL